METSQRHKLLVLDAMRGLAAFTVVLYHRSSNPPFPHANLAVDFFFMLSGFVLAFAYQAKLDNGWSTRDFFLTRLARLYPLYILGLLLAFLAAMSGPATLRPTHDWLAALINLFLLPTCFSSCLGTPYAFPYNIPAWSLFFEILANLVHALFLRRRSTSFLGGVILLSATSLIWWTGRRPVNFGSNNSELLGAFARVIFAYVTGMLLCRLWKQSGKKTPLQAPALAIFLLLVLGGFGASTIGPWFDLIAIIGIFPIIIFLGASATLPRPAAGVAKEFGATSYGVYILHHSVIRFLTLHGWLSPKAGGRILHAAASLAFVVGIFCFASVVDRLYDAPVRALLKKLITVPSANRLAADRPV